VPSPIPPALVLTAGRGSRLAPLTQVRAKPAVPVAGIPLVLRVLRWLSAQGVPSAVLNLHHKPETITSVVGHGGTAGLPVRYSWETTLLGSAGGPRRAAALLGPRFFIVNGDTLVDLDLGSLLRAHEATAADVTMAVSDNPDPTRYGGILSDDTGRLTGFTPAGRPSQHFVGVQLVESSVFQSLPDGEPAATVGGHYDGLLRTQSATLRTHHTTARFFDVGTPADYLATSMAIAAEEGMTTTHVSDQSRVQPTAELSRTIIWDNAFIDEGCRLTDCIVADGVRLPPHTVADHRMIIATPDGPLHVALEGAAHTGP